MRRTYITPEYKNSPINGTFNMVEESNYFGSKMLDVEDYIHITNQNIIYYQQPNGEQIDLSIESSLISYVYSSSSDKNINHTINIDSSQPKYQKESSAKWIIDIDLVKILENYLFATLKKYRTFEGIKTEMTRTNDIDSSIRKYISNNVSNRYKYKNIDLYIQYIEIKNQSALRYKNIWNSNVVNDINLFNKIETLITFDNSKLKLSFNQEKSSDQFSFEYFFNILFEKI